MILCIHLSLKSWEQWFALILRSPTDVKRVVDLWFVQPYSCCVEKGDDFQAPYMSDSEKGNFITLNARILIESVYDLEVSISIMYFKYDERRKS